MRSCHPLIKTLCYFSVVFGSLCDVDLLLLRWGPHHRYLPPAMHTAHTSRTPLFPNPCCREHHFCPYSLSDLYLDMTSFGRLSMAHQTQKGPPRSRLVLPQVLGLNLSSTCALGGRLWFTAGLRAAGLEQTVRLWLLAPPLPSFVSTEQPLHLQSLFLSYKFRQFQAPPWKVIMNLERFCMHPLCASNSPQPTASASKR